MELEESNIEFTPVVDRRPLIPEPLPVKLIAVKDMRAFTVAGLDARMDAFYVGILQFVLDPASVDSGGSPERVYRADNFRLRLVYVDGQKSRDDLRPIGIEVRSLGGVERQLITAEIEYERQRALIAGLDTLLLRDPSGNWVALSEAGQAV